MCCVGYKYFHAAYVSCLMLQMVTQHVDCGPLARAPVLQSLSSPFLCSTSSQKYCHPFIIIITLVLLTLSLTFNMRLASGVMDWHEHLISPVLHLFPLYIQSESDLGLSFYRRGLTYSNCGNSDCLPPSLSLSLSLSLSSDLKVQLCYVQPLNNVLFKECTVRKIVIVQSVIVCILCGCSCSCT